MGPVKDLKMRRMTEIYVSFSKNVEVSGLPSAATGRWWRPKGFLKCGCQAKR